MTSAEKSITEYLGSETLMHGLMVRLKEDGFAIVPIEATPFMKTRGYYSEAWTSVQNIEAAGGVWSAMIDEATGS